MKRKRPVTADVSSSPKKPDTRETSGIAFRTRNAEVQLEPLKEIIQDSPRKMKRARDTTVDDKQTAKNAMTPAKTTTTEVRRTDTTAHVSPPHDGDLPLDPARRRKRSTIKPAIPQPRGALSEAAGEPPHREQTWSDHGSMAPASGALDQNGKARGSQLSRPNIRKSLKQAPSSGGERVFDVSFDEDPDQRQMLPAVGARASKKQNSKTRTTSVKSVAIEGNDGDGGISQHSTPRRRGRPRKGTHGKMQLEDAERSSPRALRAGHHSRKAIPTASSKNTVPAPPEVTDQISDDDIAEGGEDDSEDYEEDSSREGDEDEEDADDEEQAMDDNQEMNIEPQRRQSAPKEDIESDNDPHTPVLALLGQERSWYKLMGEVRNICRDPKGNTSSKAKAVHCTRTMELLSKDIRRVRVQYETLEKGKGYENVQGTSEEHLNEALDKVEMQIKDIKEYDVSQDGEERSRHKGSETIRDIYLRGVPDMIYLLRAAITHHFCAALDGYNIQGIREVIRIQDMTLRLCRTAVSWKTKPAVAKNQYIKKPIRSIVYPRLRDDLRKHFAIELQRLSIRERKKHNHEKWQAQHIQPTTFVREEAPESEQRDEVLRRMADGIKQSQEKFRAKVLGLAPQYNERQSSSLRPSHSSIQHVRQGTPWTRTEVRELLVQLQTADSCYLPCKPRRLTLRNASLP